MTEKHAPPPHSAQPERSCLLSSRKKNDVVLDDDEKTLKHANKQKRILSRQVAVESTSLSSSSKQRGITVVHKEQLPSFSCERYFLLSELQVHAADFWQQQQQQQQDDDEQHDSSDKTNKNRTSLFWCLYLFWRPELQCTPNDYIRNVIRPVLRELNSQQVFLVVDRLVLEDDIDDVSDNNSSSSSSRTTQQTTTTTTTTSSSTTAFEEAEHDAEILVQTVAKQLREEVQGITVGLSNHKRAAPGLEVCYQTVTFGAGERQRLRHLAKSSSSSLIGLACQHADDLLGHDPHPQETDAVQNVHQVRISAEWNKGSFQEFAQRAHAVWLKDHHCHYDERNHPSRIIDEDTVNFAVLILLVMYLLFHTRSWWWDFIFSTRAH